MPLVTDSYLSMLTSFPHVPPISVLTFFFLGLMRLAPVVVFAPFLGSKLPAPLKVGLLISLTAVILPFMISKSSLPPPTFDHNFLLCSLKEILIGFILAILVSVPSYVAQSSGILVDFLRGSSALMATDVLTQNQSSPIGLLYNYVFVVLFYQIGGLFMFLEGFVSLYNVIPADGWINLSFFSVNQPFWHFCMSLLTYFTALSIQLGAPCIVAILMAEVFLGIANRLAPQVQIAFLGMALKSLLGLLLLWAGWFFILEQVGKQTLLWLQQLSHLLLSLPKSV